MPMMPISTVLTCERVLTEGDGVMSIIRMVDLFYFVLKANVPIEEQPVYLTVLAIVRVPSGDDEEHTFQIQLIRPNEERTVIGDPLKAKLGPKISGAPRGLNLVAKIGVVPKQTGIHYISLLFDGVETTRTAFTLVERKAEKSG